MRNLLIKNSRFRLTPLCCALIPLLCLTIRTVHAEDEKMPTVELEPIMVTANPLYKLTVSNDNEYYNANVATVGTKIPDFLENIPQSVSVVTQAKIEDLNVSTLDQLAKKTSGLRVLQNDDGRSSIFSRGYEYDQFSIDGLAAPMASINGTLPNLIAFDRVEVMRGPSGLFNSASEMGGVVNLVRKRGQAAGANRIKVDVGNLSKLGASADMQGSLSADESWTGRFIVSHNQSSNDAIDKIDADSNKNTTTYFSIDKQLSDTSKFGIGYLQQSRSITPNNGLPTLANNQLLDLPHNYFYGSKWNDFATRNQDVFADFQHRLDSKGFLSARLRYANRHTDYNYSFAGSALVNDKTNVAGTAGDIEERSFTADVNISQPFILSNTLSNKDNKAKQSEFVIGVDYKHFENNSQRANSRGLARSLTAEQINELGYIDILDNARNKNKGYRFSDNETMLNEVGVYGKVNYVASDRLNLIVGGRLSHYDIESKNKIQGNVAKTNDDHKATGYGAIVYKITPNINAYTSYTQVFMPQYISDKQGNLLKPRSGEQVEVGLKGHWSDNLSARLSGYRLTDENAAAPTKDGDQLTLGKRQMQGVEFEINGEITPNWEVSAGYSYLDSEIKQASNARDDGIFLLMPKHTANLWTVYKVNNLLPNTLTLGLGMNAVGTFSSSQGVEADSNQTWDAMVSYPFSSNLTGQLNVYNLLNDRHYVRVGSNNTFNIPNDDREIKASLTYKF